jgi:uncharacterized protein YcfL
MKKILSVVLLFLLVNCSTTTNSTKEEQKPSINNVIDVIKTIQIPKM